MCLLTRVVADRMESKASGKYLLGPEALQVSRRYQMVNGK